MIVEFYIYLDGTIICQIKDKGRKIKLVNSGGRLINILESYSYQAYRYLPKRNFILNYKIYDYKYGDTWGCEGGCVESPRELCEAVIDFLRR